MTEKPPENVAHTFSHLTVEDMHALQVIKNYNEWLRAVSCTLARRGAAFRQKYPERGSEILEALSPLPYYKAGQFLFDLLEWEDFMLDGPPPPVLNTVLDAHTLNHLASLLKTFRTYLDSGQFMANSPDQFRQFMNVEMNNLIVDDRQLPPLKASFYLYHDVILGLYTSTLENVPPSLPESPRPKPGDRVCINFNGLKEEQVEIDSVIYQGLKEEQVVLHSMKYQWLTFLPLKDPLRFMELGDPPGVIKLSFPSSGMRVEFPGPAPVKDVTLTVNNYGGPKLHFVAYNGEQALKDYDFTLPIHEVVKTVEFSPHPLTAIEITSGGESSLIEVCYTVPEGG